MKRYHKEIGFPQDLPKLESEYILKYSDHAIQACIDEGIIPTHYINMQRCTLVEVAVNSKHKITSVVVRLVYNKTHDLIIVFSPKTKYVKTVWLNKKQDMHKNLNRGKYERV